jgi:hypothetical protein
MLALGRPKTRQIGGFLIEVSCNTTLDHGTIGFMGLGCLAAASVFCALETCWRCLSAVNASAARSFAVFKLAMRCCSGVLGKVLISAIFMWVFIPYQFRQNTNKLPLFLCDFFSER